MELVGGLQRRGGGKIEVECHCGRVVAGKEKEAAYALELVFALALCLSVRLTSARALYAPTKHHSSAQWRYQLARSSLPISLLLLLLCLLHRFALAD